MVASVVEGTLRDNLVDADLAKESITESMKREKAKGFSEVIVSKDLAEGLSYL